MNHQHQPSHVDLKLRLREGFIISITCTQSAEARCGCKRVYCLEATSILHIQKRGQDFENASFKARDYTRCAAEECTWSTICFIQPIIQFGTPSSRQFCSYTKTRCCTAKISVLDRSASWPCASPTKGRSEHGITLSDMVGATAKHFAREEEWRRENLWSSSGICDSY